MLEQAGNPCKVRNFCPDAPTVVSLVVASHALRLQSTKLQTARKRAAHPILLDALNVREGIRHLTGPA